MNGIYQRSCTVGIGGKTRTGILTVYHSTKDKNRWTWSITTECGLLLISNRFFKDSRTSFSDAEDNGINIAVGDGAVDRIICNFARKHGVSVDRIMSPDTGEDVQAVRREIYAHLNKMGYKFKEIGQIVGGRTPEEVMRVYYG